MAEPMTHRSPNLKSLNKRSTLVTHKAVKAEFELLWLDTSESVISTNETTTNDASNRFIGSLTNEHTPKAISLRIISRAKTTVKK